MPTNATAAKKPASPRRKPSVTAEATARAAKVKSVPLDEPRTNPPSVIRAKKRVDDDDDSPSLLLPFPGGTWTEGSYVAPIAFLRSALFAVIGKGARREYKSEVLAAGLGSTIIFTGTQLDQSDEDVFLTMLHRAREHGLGSRVSFSMRSMLKELGWDISGKSAARLRESFNRLFVCSVVIDTESLHYQGHLVDAYRVDKKNADFYYFRLNPDMVQFFNLPEYVRIAINDRKKIKGMLAKWLHAYIEVGPDVVVSTIDEIIHLSGSTTTVKRRQRASIQSALRELEEADIIASWKMEFDSVTIYKKRSRIEQKTQ